LGVKPHPPKTKRAWEGKIMIRSGEGDVRAFIDYQVKLKHRIYIPEENKIYKVDNSKLTNFLKDKGIREIFIESAPKAWIQNLVNNDIKVHILRIKNHRAWRKKHNLKKSHENDVKLLYLLYKGNPRIFREYFKRQLNNDPEIQRYALILREIKRTKQKITVNKKLGLPTDKLEEYKRTLAKEQVKLLNYLSKKYSKILNKFRDIKGLAGGNLLYLLTLIPEIKSFRSTRSFLIYLGLRGVGKHYNNWNREARDTLIRIATRVAVCNKIKFNPKKPNWPFLRKLAVTIYQRLREESGDG